MLPSVPSYVGTIGQYVVTIMGDWLFVDDPLDTRNPRPDHTIKVPNYGTAIFDLAARPGARLGLGILDDMRIFYVYDTEDAGFGYAFNIDWPAGSEWGYCPFPSDDRVRLGLDAA